MSGAAYENAASVRGPMRWHVRRVEVKGAKVIRSKVALCGEPCSDGWGSALEPKSAVTCETCKAKDPR